MNESGKLMKPKNANWFEILQTERTSLNILKFEKKKYFSDRRFSREDVQLLFALRTRMTNCKSNFKMQFANNLTCRICKLVQYTDVFGDVNSQYNAVQVYKKVIRKRNIHLEKIENS